jgi:hypothetical protein
MLLKIKALFSKKKIKKLLRSTLCIFLSVLTVICFGGVLAPTQAEAVAGIDDAIIFFLGAFLVCCGMTFTSTSAITDAAQDFYDSSPPDVQEIIEYNAHQVEVDSALGKGFVAVLKSQWKSLIDEFVNQFPQYSNINLDSTNILKEQLGGKSLIAALVAGSTISFSNPWKQDTNVFIQTSSSTTMSFYGIDTFKKVFGESIYKSMCDYNAQFKERFNMQYAVLSIPALDCSLVKVIGSGRADTAVNIDLRYTDYGNNTQYFYLNNSVIELGTDCLIYKGDVCSSSYNYSTGFTLISQTYGNVVSRWIADDVISADSNLIDCDNLTIRSIGAVGSLFLGQDVFGVGVDAAHIPGIDSFPSTADDLTDVSTYPDTIPISVPQDLTDTISKTAEDIRTLDKDKTDTKDDTKEDPDTKPNKPSIPALSLPEILFKEKFPFCLPWDVYNVFANLVAEPEAPVFEIPMKWEFLDIDYTLKIDFSMFDEIAKISRFFSSLGFVVFLILISRKVIGAE